MAGAQPPAPPKEPPLEPPLLGDVFNGEDQQQKAQGVLRSSKSGCVTSPSLTKSMSESPFSDCSLQEALHQHHEVMQQWMARVEKQMQLLQDSTEAKLEDAVAKLTEVVRVRRRSRQQLTIGSSRGTRSDELGKKVIHGSASFGGGSRSLEEMREVARKAFEQDIGPSRVQASKTGAKLDLETEQTQGAGERRGSTSNKSISVVIPDLPGAPVFDAHGGEKRAASTTSLEKPIDAVPSQSSRSQQQCQRLPSGSSNPERPCDALLPHPSSRWLPERPTDDTSRPNSATRKSLSQGAGRVPSYRSSGSVRGQSESDGEDKDVVCKTRSRRKSVELLNVRRVVSSGNLTDVFKERERPKKIGAGLGGC